MGSILMMYVRTYVSVTLRNVSVTSRRNVAKLRFFQYMARGMMRIRTPSSYKHSHYKIARH